ADKNSWFGAGDRVRATNHEPNLQDYAAEGGPAGRPAGPGRLRRSRMKRWSALVVPVLLVVAVSLASPLAVAAQQTIRVGADTAFPPFEFVDEETGEYTGFDMELIRAIGEVMGVEDRKSTRLNSSHVKISYAVFCLEK